MHVCYRPGFKAGERPKVTSSREAFGIFRQGWDEVGWSFWKSLRYCYSTGPTGFWA